LCCFFPIFPFFLVFFFEFLLAYFSLFLFLFFLFLVFFSVRSVSKRRKREKKERKNKQTNNREKGKKQKKNHVLGRFLFCCSSFFLRETHTHTHTQTQRRPKKNFHFRKGRVFGVKVLSLFFLFVLCFVFCVFSWEIEPKMKSTFFCCFVFLFFLLSCFSYLLLFACFGCVCCCFLVLLKKKTKRLDMSKCWTFSPLLSELNQIMDAIAGQSGHTGEKRKKKTRRGGKEKNEGGKKQNKTKTFSLVGGHFFCLFLDSCACVKFVFSFYFLSFFFCEGSCTGKENTRDGFDENELCKREKWSGTSLGSRQKKRERKRIGVMKFISANKNLTRTKGEQKQRSESKRHQIEVRHKNEKDGLCYFG